MNHKVFRRILVLMLLVSFSAAIVLAGRTGAAHAGVWDVQIVQSSCNGATITFYYDGLNALSTWNPAYPKADRFRIQAWNRTCASGNCNFKLGENWQTIPSSFGTITMSISWAPVIPTGNGIELIVGQYNINEDPASVVDRDMAGIELHTFYTCAGGTTAAGSTGGHAAPGFLFYCTGTGVGVSNAGVAVLQATFSQIAGPLQTATTTAKNILITSGGGVSLWALKSNELQVHYDSNPDATKLIVPSNVCGAVATQAAQPVTGSYVPPATGQVTAGRTTYVVQPGDNLFRISLRFGRTMDTIAAANGITNYALIYVGQVLVIP